MTKLNKDLLDYHAVGMVKHLQRAGHLAYLVGGCVRDLLIGQSPKDFDIGTSAKPGEVRKLISFSFIVGKRFRLVLVKRGENIERLGPCPDLLSHFSSSDRRLFYYKYYDEQTQPDKVIASLSRLNIFNDALNVANEIFNTDTVVTNYFKRAAKISDGLLTEPQFSSLIAELKNKIKAIQNLKPNNIPEAD